MEALANAVEHFESLSFRVLLTINGQLVRNPNFMPTSSERQPRSEYRK